MLKIQEIYQKEAISKLKDKFGYKNTFDVPKITKVLVNMGIGAARENPKLLDMASADLAIITGQKPLITKAKKAISGFKIRKGEKVGLKITLRKNRMYDFLERFTRIALPRIRDFRGLKTSGFDGSGNYSIGIKEHTVFPEIKYDKVERNFGLQVTINTTAKSKEETKELLTILGFPFEKGDK